MDLRSVLLGGSFGWRTWTSGSVGSKETPGIGVASTTSKSTEVFGWEVCEGYLILLFDQVVVDVQLLPIGHHYHPNFLQNGAASALLLELLFCFVAHMCSNKIFVKPHII